ncbi:smg-4/UPF3 family protein [Hirsutella rhossiliensis]|uniref:Smg-4/UPF3 family domain-containing protein n=1 Tax=Hirsutella rhossiliensis TaxID=111463 RepID=A0A9P8SMI3_9HYPO|nr:smg-4/UPF3 family domain-containing protein [Hirsutella rhossiliensis]KAH0966890.1 smg-4/UPF3 family domain-containing protein [Hirsutella rhossiliensis]
MSAPAPQVLPRRPNGAPHATAGPQSDSLPKVSRRLGGSRRSTSNDERQVKSSRDGHPQRPARGRGAGDKSGDAAKEPSRRSKPKAHSEGEKLVIRRLPPGMTQAEFVSILGPDWELNKGKVDWFSYCPGKISTDPAKPSRPSRAYLHVMRKDDIMPLSQAVRAATWEDAKSTFTSPSLIGPPSFEFSTYKKIPGNRRRTDPRQGTIDQDQEFMAFLEGLANPVPLRESIDVEDADEAAKEDTKITTTPLVEFLKEKKANKAKEGGSGKNAKSVSAKGKGGSKEEDSSKKRSKEPKADKSDKPAREPVKILMKKASTEQPAEAPRNAVSHAAAANASDAPKSRRAGIAAAARILQRDLGLSPGSAHRRARHDAAKAEGDTKPPTKEPTASPPKGRSKSPVAAKSQPAGRRARSGKATAEKSKSADNNAAPPAAVNPPVILKKKGDDEAPQTSADARPATAKSAANGKPTPAPSANATRGGGSGNKSAASQKRGPAGATEAALRQALDVFGAITLVEVDKRKGFAYVDFAEHDGLVKAINASPVQVAQTAVQVLERKDKKPAAASSAAGASPGAATAEKTGSRGRRGRGGGGGNRANGTATGPAPAAASASTGGSG